MMPVQTLRQHILENWATIREAYSRIGNSMNRNQYRRVEIPKPDGRCAST